MKKSASGKVSSSDGAAPIPTTRVLVVEDSESSRAAICEHLRDEQFEPEEAENGAIGVEKFEAGSFDLILMDIRMPTMDGYEAIRRIRAWEQTHHLARTPIIAFTASSLEEDVERAREAGADLHVAKPVKREALATAIRSLLRSEDEGGAIASS
ncbi:MAG TPA: response regulator [Candidatus Binataceae bacterium]|nr:response regulator [Candidatus Binataceae bacterium]